MTTLNTVSISFLSALVGLTASATATVDGREMHIGTKGYKEIRVRLVEATEKEWRALALPKGCEYGDTRIGESYAVAIVVLYCDKEE